MKGQISGRNKYRFTAVLLFAVAVLAGLFTVVYKNSTEQTDDAQTMVVTSFYPMYIAAANVVGDCKTIRLQNLSEPQTGCLHDFQLTPEDMKLLSKADVFVVNGGGIETFLQDVAEQFPEISIVNASKNVELLGENAHAWMSVSDYRRQVSEIAEGLAAVSPDDEEELRSNAAAYDAKLADLEEQQQRLKEIAAGTKVISLHEAYEYVAGDYGMDVVYTLNLDEERQVSAGETADVVRAIEENGISVVLAEELYGSDMGDMIERETGAAVYYLDTLVRGEYDPDSYINGMQENINKLGEIFEADKLE